MQDSSSPWYRASMAVLGAPAVQIKPSVKRFVGLMPSLKPLLKMHTSAQRLRCRNSHKGSNATKSTTRAVEMSPSDRQNLELGALLLDDAEMQTAACLICEAAASSGDGASSAASLLPTWVSTSMRANIKACPDVVEGVCEIRRARLVLLNGARERAEVDCTTEASKILREGGGRTMHLRGDRLQKLLRQATKGEQQASRNESHGSGSGTTGYQFGDLTKTALRAGARGIKIIATEVGLDDPIRALLLVDYFVEHGVVGATSFVERGALGASFSPYLMQVRAFMDDLNARPGLVRPLHVGKDGEFTFYKLSEWMQVEIIEAFGSSLSHVAWYRFPFWDMVRMYFHVLTEEVRVVHRKLGFKEAFLSSALAIDVVPGIMMAFYFAQLEAFAMPLRLLWGSGTTMEEQEAEKRGEGGESNVVEELVVRVRGGSGDPAWETIDPRITNPRRLLPQLYAIEVPPFHALTEVLCKLAAVGGKGSSNSRLQGTGSELQVLQVSNQPQVQVRVQVRTSKSLEALGCRPGVEVLFKYKFPVDGSGTAPATSVALCVDVPHLLCAIRYCSANDVAVKQIYDFWN